MGVRAQAAAPNEAFQQLVRVPGIELLRFLFLLLLLFLLFLCILSVFVLFLLEAFSARGLVETLATLQRQSARRVWRGRRSL